MPLDFSEDMRSLSNQDIVKLMFEKGVLVINPDNKTNGGYKFLKRDYHTGKIEKLKVIAPVYINTNLLVGEHGSVEERYDFLNNAMQDKDLRLIVEKMISGLGNTLFDNGNNVIFVDSVRDCAIPIYAMNHFDRIKSVAQLTEDGKIKFWDRYLNHPEDKEQYNSFGGANIVTFRNVTATHNSFKSPADFVKNLSYNTMHLYSGIDKSEAFANGHIWEPPSHLTYSGIWLKREQIINGIPMDSNYDFTLSKVLSFLDNPTEQMRVIKE